MEVRLQQAVAVHEHYSLGISLVGLLARNVLHVFRIGQQDIKAFLLKEEVQAYPVGAYRVHCHGGDAAGIEPRGNLLVIVCKTTKTTIIVTFMVFGGHKPASRHKRYLCLSHWG